MTFDELKDYYVVYRAYFYTVAVMVVCVVVLLVANEKQQQRELAKTQWPQTEAVILEAEIFEHRSSYRKTNVQNGVGAQVFLRLGYEVENRPVTTSLNEGVRVHRSSNLNEIFAVGSTVPIRYNPKELHSVQLHPSVFSVQK